MESIIKCTLRQQQEVLLSLLQEFDRICKKHHIPYQLFAGTALGALRHGGFIPWDDDLDVIMLRPDYERFMALAPAELDETHYCLQQEHSPHWPLFFSKLRKNGTTCYERYIPKDPLTHHGVYMDIFPCDNLSDRRLFGKFQFYLSKIVIAKGLSRRGYETDSFKKKLFMACCRLIPQKPIKRLVQLPGHSETKMVHSFFSAASKYEKNVFPRSWLQETVSLEFEGQSFPVSAHYEELLHRLYGDYMTLPSEEERACKIHGVIVDLEHSYEMYRDLLSQQNFTEYSRSIR